MTRNVAVVAFLALPLAVVAAAMLLSRTSMRADREAAAQPDPARLQALAETQPEKVFHFAAAPAKDSFQYTEEITVLLDVTNPTPIDLHFPWRKMFIKLWQPRARVSDHDWAEVERFDGETWTHPAEESRSMKRDLIPAGHTARYRLSTNAYTFRKEIDARGHRPPFHLEAPIVIIQNSYTSITDTPPEFARVRLTIE